MLQKRTVLVIDDEEYVADALRIVLNDSGYRATVALTGSAGLRECEHQVFDVTITDLRLPDIPGMDVLTGIRRRQPASVIIVISSYGTPEIVAQILDLGSTGFLAKPFCPSELIELIESLISPEPDPS